MLSKVLICNGVAVVILAIGCHCASPAKLSECFGGTNFNVGSSPGNAEYTANNLTCFDSIGSYTNSCNMTAMGYSSATDVLAWCMAGPPYVNLLGCCSACALWLKDIGTTEINNMMNTIVNVGKTCFNGIETSLSSQLPTGTGCAKLAASNPNMCAPKTINMCKFAFFNCRQYCHSKKPAFGWCSSEPATAK